MSAFNKPPPSRPVYSTELGRLCPKCGRAKKDCSCKGTQKDPATTQTDGIVRIWLETKGRKGKGVSVIKGVPVSSEALEALGKRLKQKCGSGGTVKEGQIEIQGDHRDLLMKELLAAGFKVKKAGG
jgi:translation initiation factor 1